MSEHDYDLGDLMTVPESQHTDVDPPLEGQLNDDVDADMSFVPAGQYLELSTASDDEPVGDGNAEDEPVGED